MTIRIEAYNPIVESWILLIESHLVFFEVPYLDKKKGHPEVAFLS